MSIPDPCWRGGTIGRGCRALAGLLAAAGARDLRIERLDLRTSGDTAGHVAPGRDQVVGYGPWALYEG
jgi:MEMO1 family protein